MRTEVGRCGGCTDDDPEDDERVVTRPTCGLAVGRLLGSIVGVPANC